MTSSWKNWLVLCLLAVFVASAGGTCLGFVLADRFETMDIPAYVGPEGEEPDPAEDPLPGEPARDAATPGSPAGSGAVSADATANQTPFTPEPEGAFSPTVVTPAYGQPLDGVTLYETVCRQVVIVRTTMTPPEDDDSSPMTVTGAGIIVTRDGYILTNQHVVAEEAPEGWSSQLQVILFDNTKYPARVIASDAYNDVAVLKVAAEGLEPAVFGRTEDIKIGMDVFAVGHPLTDLTFSFTEGIVGGLDRLISTDDGSYTCMFQISAPVNSGNSGGPVFDQRGVVIGMVTAKYASLGVEGLGFATPVDDLLHAARDLVTYGRVTGRPRLGITVQSGTGVTVDGVMIEGARVVEVVADSCGEKAGMLAEDLVYAINGRDVDGTDTLLRELRRYHAGDTVTITVLRQGISMDLAVTLDERPESLK